MARYTLEDGQYEEDWSDKVEPYTAGLGLASDVVGLTTAATGVGAPIGGTIALIGNVPNFIVDAYQMGRDWYRYYNDGGGNNLKGALWNTGETVLDMIGGKLALKGSKVVMIKLLLKNLMLEYKMNLIDVKDINGYLINIKWMMTNLMLIY